ncbi:condensation domain-containing protein [Streptomyces sp. NPDC005408]|uniref:condensation domain-containing protein n=1 Tax=Streptomyces sp. NPDC005408 TaxID=3155341 RepID=UPI0033B6B8F9
MDDSHDPPRLNDRALPGDRNGTEILTDIWRKLLAIDEIGPEDNFFRLGGDSIIALQMVTLARRSGLALNVPDIFKHPTIAALTARDAHALPAVERVPVIRSTKPGLSPMQLWFLEGQPAEALHQYNFAKLIAVPAGISSGDVRALATSLFTRHASLRLRFDRIGDSWQGVELPLDEELVQRAVQLIDLRGLPPELAEAAVTTHSNAVQAKFDVRIGPLFRLVSYDHGLDRPGELLIAAHHLLVDGVSWRVLLDDIEAALAQLAAGEPTASEPGSDALQAWLAALRQYAASDRLRTQRDYWLRVLERDGPGLPVDRESAISRAGSACEVAVALSPADTADLLRLAATAHQTRINELLLAALLLAVNRWASVREICVDLEGHGRTEVAEDVDVSATVGWFTSKYPVQLSMPDTQSADVASVVDTVERELSRVPDGGVGYGVLRYLLRDAEIAAREARSGGQILFNYLGRWGGDGDPFSRDRLVALRGPQYRLPYLFEITGQVGDDVMRFTFVYDENRYDAATVDALAEGYLAALRRVIRDGTRLPGPLDVPADTIEQLTRAGAVFSDVYPATPLQKGILVESLVSADPGTYVVQELHHLSRVDPAGWHAACHALMRRHPVLSTSFTPCAHHGYVQVVNQEVPLPWRYVDLRGVAAHRQEEETARLAAQDAADGFEPEHAPLIRFLLVRTGADSAAFCVTFHHALLDGWSTAILYAELRRLYDRRQAGEELVLPPAPPFRSFVEWLATQEAEPLRAFWEHWAEGVDTEPLKDVPRLGRGGVVGARHATLTLDADDTLALTTWASANDLTLATVIQGAWTLVLRERSRSATLSYGVTVSGRHPAIPHVESIVGPLINTLPVKVTCANGTPAVEWLRELQSSLLELEQYGAMSLYDIQRVAATSRQPLFDTLVVFQNFPQEPTGVDASRDWSMTSTTLRDQTHYDLTLVVTAEHSVNCDLVYRSSRLFEQDARSLISSLESFLQAIAGAGPDTAVGEVLRAATTASSGHEQPPGREAFRRAAAALAEEEERQQALLHLTANENVMSAAVQAHLSSGLAGRYHLGTSRDYQRKDVVDKGGLVFRGLPHLYEVEAAAAEVFRRRLGGAVTDFRPLSGVHAMMCTILSVTEPGDVVLSINPDNGGHFATANLVHALGRRSVLMDFDHATLGPDLDELRRLRRRRGGIALAYLDDAVPLYPMPVGEIRAILGPDTLIAYDASHVLGLLMGGVWGAPVVDGWDIIQGNTHKTFPGPQKGILHFADPRLAAEAMERITAGLVSSQHTHHAAALYLSAIELDPHLPAYAAQTVANAQALSQHLRATGLRLLTGGARPTQTHQLFVFPPAPFSGLAAVRQLLECGISVNSRITYGNDVIRVGVQEVTRRGMTEPQMATIADIIAGALVERRRPELVRERVRTLAEEFATVRYTSDELVRRPLNGPARPVELEE